MCRQTSKMFYAAGLLLCLTCEGNTGDSMAKEMISAHNFYRTRVGTPPLAWSNDLATRAHEWATKLIENGTFAQRRDGLFGENLFEISGGSANPSKL
jgi:uncharacterized protein YkwD